MDVYKQKLNIKDQVKYLEDKGISFNLFSKSNAEDYLTNNNYYYKLTSFRKISENILMDQIQTSIPILILHILLI